MEASLEQLPFTGNQLNHQFQYGLHLGLWKGTGQVPEEWLHVDIKPENSIPRTSSSHNKQLILRSGSHYPITTTTVQIHDVTNSELDGEQDPPHCLSAQTK